MAGKGSSLRAATGPPLSPPHLQQEDFTVSVLPTPVWPHSHAITASSGAHQILSLWDLNWNSEMLVSLCWLVKSSRWRRGSWGSATFSHVDMQQPRQWILGVKESKGGIKRYEDGIRKNMWGRGERKRAYAYVCVCTQKKFWKDHTAKWRSLWLMRLRAF